MILRFSISRSTTFDLFFTAVIYPVVKVHRRGGSATSPGALRSSCPLVGGLSEGAHGSGEAAMGPGHRTTARGPACEPSMVCAVWDPVGRPGDDPGYSVARLMMTETSGVLRLARWW